MDIFIANGHVYPEVEQATPGTHYRQINSLFHNEGNGKFVEVGKSSATGFETLYVGCGVAFADFDNRRVYGHRHSEQRRFTLVLHNSGGNGNHFLNFKLSRKKSNRDAMGARVRVVTGTTSQIREIASGGSYLSQSALRANFGIAKAKRAETVEITWPSGHRQTFRDVEADKFYLVEEGNDHLQTQHISGRQP